MLKIDPQYVRALQAAASKEELQVFLQNAIELEHATIPPYLTAMYSLRPGANEEISSLIRSVVIEEMLHMTISANILIATGGSPRINDPRFVPTYPGPLPMGIGGDLVVPIQAFSKELVKNVFMEIEEPENPVPVSHGLLMTPEYVTIGQFYQAIQDKIRELGDGIFVVGPERQMLTWFDPQELFPIVDVESANRALELVVIEGEGTSSDPFESPGEPAHYYRFGEIYYGRKLIATPDGYSYAGEPIAFDEEGVFPMIDNPQESDYAPGSQVALLSEIFTAGYSNLLNALHQTFNGAPERIDTAIGLMYQLRLQAQKLMSTPVEPGSERTAGPVYRYVPAT
ncbi:MAG TPA: ferritin-like protein [Thermoanaerobaculia bacterium]|nr:ferritin-like protein [Thermoanaerobaculia bacterium]